jgi:sulfoxide reductase heme-binding subunit YedZ
VQLENGSGVLPLHYARNVPKRVSVMRWVKLGLCAWSVVPALDLVWVLERMNRHFVRAYDYRVLTVAIATTGLWAFVFLLAALACTPLARLSAWRWPVEIRRTLGLFAFFYSLLHLGAYFVIGQKLRIDYVFADAWIRKSRLPGWGALLLLIPLAVTSTDGMVRRLGARHWKQLHRLVYVASALALWHLAWTDADHHSPFERTKYALLPFALLLVLRVVPLSGLRRRLQRSGIAPSSVAESSAAPSSVAESSGAEPSDE